MASSSNKPVSTYDQGPEEKSKKDLPNREDAADRAILPGQTVSEEPVVDTTGYVSNTGEDAPAAVGDPDSIAAYKKIQDEEAAAAEAQKAAKEAE